VLLGMKVDVCMRVGVGVGVDVDVEVSERSPSGPQSPPQTRVKYVPACPFRFGFPGQDKNLHRVRQYLWLQRREDFSVRGSVCLLQL